MTGAPGFGEEDVSWVCVCGGGGGGGENLNINNNH
jgi:hypothetical protein